MEYANEGQAIVLKYLREEGYKIVGYIDPGTRIVRIFARDNDNPERTVTLPAGCMCGKCTKQEVQKAGAYVNVGAFPDMPTMIWVGFTEKADETWEIYDLHEPDALEIIKERVDWGLENWTPEKTKKSKCWTLCRDAS